LVEGTRVLIVDVMTKGSEVEEEDVEESVVETDVEAGTSVDAEEQKFEMDVARVYEQTIMQLGERLDGNGGFGPVS
jgi:hypothetical protein